MPSIRQGDRAHMVSGYAYTTSQYGLTIDNVAGYELVLPNGTVLSVTSKDEDLWFGLRVSEKSSILVGVSKKVATFREG